MVFPRFYQNYPSALSGRLTPGRKCTRYFLERAYAMIGQHPHKDDEYLERVFALFENLMSIYGARYQTV